MTHGITLNGPAAAGLVLILILAGGLPAGAQSIAALDIGEKVYRSACAACHGPDGRGAPQTAVGFDVPVPDFTNCSFNSREPSADWFAIGHDGGPVRAFDARMPAFGRALTPSQLEMAVAHIKDFCAQPAWPPGELNLPRPHVTIAGGQSLAELPSRGCFERTRVGDDRPQEIVLHDMQQVQPASERVGERPAIRQRGIRRDAKLGRHEDVRSHVFAWRLPDGQDRTRHGAGRLFRQRYPSRHVPRPCGHVCPSR